MRDVGHGAQMRDPSLPRSRLGADSCQIMQEHFVFPNRVELQANQQCPSCAIDVRLTHVVMLR